MCYSVFRTFCALFCYLDIHRVGFLRKKNISLEKKLKIVW